MSAACALSPSALDTSYSLGKRSRSGEEDYYAQAKRTRQFSSSGLQARRAALAALQNLYPSMAERDLEQVLEVCDNDVEAAIRRLDSLNLGGERRPEGAAAAAQGPAAETRGAEEAGPEESAVPRYVESLVQEMVASRDVEDARQRATRALQHFEADVRRTCEGKAAAAQAPLLRENGVLKRAVAIQNNRHQEFAAAATAENEELKKQLARAQGELHAAQLSNYSLSLHLREAMSQQPYASQRNSDVF